MCNKNLNSIVLITIPYHYVIQLIDLKCAFEVYTCV